MIARKIKRVLFLYNGGTIGQILANRGGQIVFVPPKDSKIFRAACEPTIKNFKQKMRITFEFVTAKDSSNMTPDDWEKLIFRVHKAQEQGYDGVVIAHGTDTLAYTATALALAMHGKDPERSGLKIPVCLTGAQNPIYELGGDGRFNLENLFRVIEKAIDLGVADVLLSFWDKVLLGCRALKLSERRFDAFRSPSYPEVGNIDSNGVHLNTALVKMKKNSKGKIDLSPKFGKGVVSLELAPGTDPNVVLGFVTNGGVSAVILKSLGEGNVSSEGQYNLIPVIEQITEEYTVPVFIASKFPGGNAVATHYETGLAAIRAGGIPCFDHTDVAVDVKVRWLLGNGIARDIQDFRQAMKTSFVGEMTQH